MAPRKKSRRKNVARNLVTRNSMTTALYGRELHPRTDPRATTLIPWNSLTLVTNTAAATSAPSTVFFSSAALDSAIRAQIGLPVSSATIEIAFKLNQIKLWSRPSVTAANANIIRMAPCDLVETAGILPDTAVTRKWLEDSGTVTRPACVGYTWPIADRDRVFRSTTDEVALFLIRVSSTSQTYLLHAEVLWRTYSTTIEASTRGGFRPIA